jgi:hypothetical protein
VALYLYPGSSSPGGISRNPGPPYSSLFEPTSSHLFWVVFPWQRWDGLEYQYLASAGYHHASLQDAFYPLYPGLVHATGQLFGHDYGVAALVVSSLLLIPALAVTHQLLRMDCGVVVADRAMLYMAIAPQALVFVAP